MIDGQEVPVSHGGLRKNILTPPLLERNHFLTSTLSPWLSATESTRGRLPMDHILVQSHLSQLPVLHEEYSVPTELRGKIKDDGSWTMVGHVIDTKFERDIEQIGGVLGVGEDVDTIWEPQMLSFHMKRNEVKGGTFYLFFVPHWMVEENMPHLPLKMFNPKLTPEDLPEAYRKSAERHFTDGSAKQIFDETKIVPLTFCIGKVRV